VAAGEGPRDWQQDDSYTFPYASGGVHSGFSSSRGGRRARSRRVRPLTAVIAVASALAIVAGIVAAVLHPSPALPASALQPGVTQPVAAGPTPVSYPTQQAERSALFACIPNTAGSLVGIANSGHPMPTSFYATAAGTLVAEPSGQTLGPLPYGITLEWDADPSGRVTQLTLVGPSFGTRAPLDISAIPLPARTGTTA
jgi:hypothetical protein